MMSRKRLLIFAKTPVPGRVKTRLTPFLTAQQAAQLHSQLVAYCLQQTAATQSEYIAELWVDHLDEYWEPLKQQYGINIFQQRGDDLGARMANAFEQVLARADAAVVIGTDCPFIDADYIRSAFKLLTDSAGRDVVVGPAEDGGYVLLGLKQLQRALFTDISWGSEHVLTQTVLQIERCALTYGELPELMDIDRPEDLQVLQQRLPEFSGFGKGQLSSE